MKVVIIGNGVAGTTTARLLAERAPSTQIVLYTQESHPFYLRPRLIELLAGQIAPEQMPQYAVAWYAQRGIELHLNSHVVAIHPDKHEIVIADGSVCSYDRLVLAMGARCWAPPIPGADLPGVHTLRTLQDTLAIQHEAKQAQQVVILGGGLLGLDTSAGLTPYGVPITVVEALPRLLPRQLDAEAAAVLQSILERRGLRILTGLQCTAIEGQGRVERVTLSNGEVLPADLVVISAGIRSNTALAQAAGLACNRGVIVDERMATSAPDIYAVGDVAEFRGVTWGLIPAALAQARVAAAQITGDATAVYEDIVPSASIKVSGIDLTSIGEVNPEQPGFVEVRETDHEKGIYKKAVLRQGRVVGAILLGDRADVRLMNQLIAQGVDISAQVDKLFRDETVFRELLRPR